MNCFKENCKKYQEERKRALEENESVMDAIYDLVDTDINCKECDYKGDCNMEDSLDFNIYDMIVIEDENGSIYQDCVCEIIKDKLGNRNVICNRFIINCKDLNVIEGNYVDGEIYLYDYMDESNISKFTLKEVWSRVNDDTYKKIWSK